MLSKTKMFIFSQLLFLYFFGSLLTSTSGFLVTVKTKQGELRGTQEFINTYLLTPNPLLFKPVYKFLGIPFALPPVGPLRFKPPQPFPQWSGVRDALIPGNDCTQVFPFFPTAFGSEDCLYLNVYTPKIGGPLKPVMFWIYGGGYQGGDSFKAFGCDFLVAKDVVLVAANYRVGPFGFLSLENDKASGNYGLKDQRQAMLWVKENIEYFGGDPNKVTIFGESAGSGSVSHHVLSQASKGLFHQAILQSGSALNIWAFAKKPLDDSIRFAQSMGKNITDKDKLYDYFMGLSSQKLSTGAMDFLVKELSDFSVNFALPFSPTKEPENAQNPFITKTPTEVLLSGNFNKVPVIIGTLNGEGILAFLARNYGSKEFEILNQSSDWAVPELWQITNKTERKRIGGEIKKFFFSNKSISWDTFTELQQLYSDQLFITEIDKLMSGILKYSQFPVYNYEMTLDTPWSILKVAVSVRQFRLINFKAAAHGDDLPLLFPPNSMQIAPFTNSDQLVSYKMTELWTTFAKTGNPNYQGFGLTWKKLEKQNRSYLEIDYTFKIRSGRVAQKRVEFWENVCKSTNTTFVCAV